MRSPRLLALPAALLLALGAAGASADPAEDTTRLFLANQGTDCGAGDAPFLTTAARTTDINCGYIGGGLPLGEVFQQTDLLASGRTFASSAKSGGVPLVADAARDASGVVTVRRGSQQGVGLPGVGQVVADVAFRVRVGTKTVDLGSQTLEAFATGNGALVELPFTVALPDSLQGAQVTAVEVDLNVRGVHLFHGFMVLNGATYLDVPTVAAETAEP